MRQFMLALLALSCSGTARAQTPPGLPAWPLWSHWAPLGTGSNPYPIMIWQTSPSATGVATGFGDAASAAIGAGINVFLNYDCPTSFGQDSCGFASLPAAAAKTGKPLFWIGGYDTDQSGTPDASGQTVRSIQTMVASVQGGTAALIGYNNGDEPQCGQQPPIDVAAVPSVVAKTNADDKTRPEFWNSLAWRLGPVSFYTGSAHTGSDGKSCEAEFESAEAATNTMSADEYALIDPYYIGGGGLGIGTTASAPSNYGVGSGIVTSNDALWVQGVVVSLMVQNAWTKTVAGTLYRQPVGMALSGGSDAKGFSAGANVMQTARGGGGGQVTAGSKTLVNATGWSQFSSIWVGLTVSGTGIPAGTTINSVQDATHATMSSRATATATTLVTVSGGINGSDCLPGVTNLCVVNGNEFRETAEEAAAEAWMGVIAGADYLVYFPYDTCSYTFLLGDTASACGPTGSDAFNNISSVDAAIQARRAWLNARTAALATMDSFDRGDGVLTTSVSAVSGPVTVTTANSHVPGHVRVSGPVSGVQAVFAQTLRRGTPGTKAGETTLLVTDEAWAGGTAAVAYDTDVQYHSARALKAGTALTISQGGTISIPFVDDYQTVVVNVTLP